MVDLVNSRDFRARLAEAARITVKTGHESGFAYYRQLEQNRSLWSPVFEGITYQLPNEYLSEWRNQAFGDEDSFHAYPLLTLHYHTDTFMLGLSREDISHIRSADLERDIRKVTCVATIEDDMSGHVLMYRPLVKGCGAWVEGLIDELWAEYRAVDPRWPSEETTQTLNKPGWVKSAMLPFSVPARNTYAILSDSDALDRFAE